MQTSLTIKAETQVAADTQRWSERATLWCVCVLVCAVALVYAPGLYSPFEVPKTATMVALAGVALAMAIVRGASWRSVPRAFVLTLATWIAVVVVSAVVAPLKYLAAPALVWIAAGVAIFTAALQLRRAEMLFACLRVLAVVVAIVALAQWALRFDPFALFGGASALIGRMRVFGTLGNPDFCAAWLAACLPAVIDTRRSVFAAAGAALCVAAIAATGSRAGIAAAAVGVTVLFAVRGGRRAWRWIAVAAILACMLLASIAAWNGRALSTALRGRAFIWRVALNDVSAFGAGPNTFTSIYTVRVGALYAAGRVAHDEEQFLSYERHAQNDFVEAVADSGVAGAVAFAAMIAVWFVFARRRRREAATQVALGTVAAIVTAAMFDFPFHRPETWTLFWVVVAIPFASEAPRGNSRAWRIPAAVLVIAAACYFAVTPLIASRFARLGEISEQRGVYATATAMYERALRWNLRDADAQFSLVRSLAQQRRYENAIAQSEVALRYVDEPELRQLRVRIFEATERFDEARAELDFAMKRFPFAQILRQESEALDNAR